MKKITPAYPQNNKQKVASPHPMHQLKLFQSYDLELTVMLKDDYGKLYPTEKKITMTIVRIPGGWLHISKLSSIFIPYSNQGIHDHELE